ncbi:hypothetical protein L484_000014 [Morus notabilis]|uniref:Uncharacterized protein n=1 Tax=Morus notabilis TaxID=981085 RepID=W9SFJ6_9ROSA|nr:hypothetical protein L484_000014 [Morus notabilis]
MEVLVASLKGRREMISRRRESGNFMEEKSVVKRPTVATFWSSCVLFGGRSFSFGDCTGNVAPF